MDWEKWELVSPRPDTGSGCCTGFTLECPVLSLLSEKVECPVDGVSLAVVGLARFLGFPLVHRWDEEELVRGMVSRSR